ncbi:MULTISPECIES: alanyl-tRNA editing protein [Pseudomonadota]|uniref:Alanyl-tRNA synthetase domain protein n=1 Tax=Bordetella petrii (strain ATCC BAA-461 / DSM 12804 / CCUG 43448 / CIP 107267 / Se-1111R) TaxID=340100 RepID=A9IE39_BORPD|nr:MULTISPECIES: alanyl-tRNA synthetase [Pseudomonadota]CAP41677.1 alanyl-tRNA synthetase domain protein [Bordetella petrii]HCK4605734.1 alanyl-tRNA editing protein [Pseudomonas aeruginosa]
MTRRLYWESNATESEVEVLNCEQLASGGYGVRLNATPFHPQGGGQPADVGWIGNVEVFQVEASNGEILHYIRQAVALGVTTAKVDAERRQRHSRLHSAGHLIGHALEPLAWRPVKAHHWPGESRVVFKPDDGAQVVDVAAVQSRCDDLIASNLPCRALVDENQFRQVRFGHLSPYACGGTHVGATADLSGLQILSAHLKKGQLTVQYEIQ